MIEKFFIDILEAASENMSQKSNSGSQEKTYAHQMVRTDAREQKIDSFYELKPSNSQESMTRLVAFSPI